MKGDYSKLRKVFMEKIKRTGGLDCPCCGQFAKIYKRKLNSEMAFGLIRLHYLACCKPIDTAKPASDSAFGSVPTAGYHGKYSANYSVYWHVSEIMRGYGSKMVGGDFAKAAHWGLIEPMANEDETKRTAGMWRLTGKGVAFARGFCAMPSHVFVYDGEPQGFSIELVKIRQALHSRFDYAELMADK